MGLIISRPFPPFSLWRWESPSLVPLVYFRIQDRIGWPVVIWECTFIRFFEPRNPCQDIPMSCGKITVYSKSTKCRFVDFFGVVHSFQANHATYSCGQTFYFKGILNLHGSFHTWKKKTLLVPGFGWPNLRRWHPFLVQTQRLAEVRHVLDSAEYFDPRVNRWQEQRTSVGLSAGDSHDVVVQGFQTSLIISQPSTVGILGVRFSDSWLKHWYNQRTPTSKSN